MNVIVCLDDKNGMMFNRRRQSRDRLLCRRVEELTKDTKLHMNQYSAGLFDPAAVPHARVSEAFLSEAADGEYCFVENEALAPYEAKIETLIVFRWNRTYPTDTRLDLDLENVWKPIAAEDFPGHSHDVITMETYKR